MENLFIQLTVLVAAVAANPSPQPDAIPDASGVHIRSEALEKRNGQLYWNFSSPNLWALYDDFGNETYTAPAHGCIRAKCWNTSGVYVCNKHSLTVSGKEIKKHIYNILIDCCFYHSDLTWNVGLKMSGQQFTDALGGNWNVVASYADCRQSKYAKPTDTGGWGVNGKACRPDTMYIH